MLKAELKLHHEIGESRLQRLKQAVSSIAGYWTLTALPFMSGKQPKRKPRPGVDEYGRTPLHNVALSGDFEALVRLLESGSSIDAQDDNGWTALHFAVQDGHSKLVEELLRRGANPNLVNSHGNSALWVGVMRARGDFSIVKRLLSAGADPDHKNAHGRSPRDMAAVMGVAGEISL